MNEQWAQSSGRMSSPVSRLRDRVQSHLDNGFRRWGSLVASWPWTVIAVATVFSLGLSIGWIAFHQETGTRNLWLPQDSRIRNHDDTYNEYIGDAL